MTKVAIDDVIVGDRARETLSNIDKLALSIHTYGLFHPIVVDRELNLVAGERRLEACKVLKSTEIEATYKDELDPIQRKELELEENLQREDLTWQEEIRGRRQLDSLKRQLYGSKAYDKNGWGLEDTADALGVSEIAVKKDIQLAKAMDVMPELKKAKTRSDAMKLLKTKRNQMAREELLRRAEKEFEESGGEEDSLVTVIHGDCVKEMREMEGESFDLCIADPPFGAGLDTQATVQTKEYDTYEDDRYNVHILVREAIKEVVRLLRPGSHCYWFFGHVEGGDRMTFDALSEHFDYVDPIPLAWYKGTGGFTVDPRKRYMPHYQPIYFARKGERPLAKKQGNVLNVEPVPQGRKKHPAEMPVGLMRIFVEQSSLPGDHVLDPFAGTGPVAVACKELRRRCTAIEEKEEFVQIIKVRLLEA